VKTDLYFAPAKPGDHLEYQKGDIALRNVATGMLVPGTEKFAHEIADGLRGPLIDGYWYVYRHFYGLHPTEAIQRAAVQAYARHLPVVVVPYVHITTQEELQALYEKHPGLTWYHC
jgi:hypothetical protein